MDTKNKQDDDWIENLLYPLLEVLELIEMLQIYMFGLKRIQFISNENNAAEPTFEIIIRMSALLEDMLEKYSMIFGNYPEVPWKKYIKIGKALENGYWHLIFQLCWKLVSRGVIQIKSVVLDLLYYADR